MVHEEYAVITLPNSDLCCSIQVRWLWIGLMVPDAYVYRPGYTDGLTEPLNIR